MLKLGIGVKIWMTGKMWYRFFNKIRLSSCFFALYRLLLTMFVKPTFPELGKAYRMIVFGTPDDESEV